MLTREVFALIVCALITSCAATTRYNLQHAYVTPGSDLPREDVEQIITVVSRRSPRIIIALQGDQHGVTVFTEGEPDSAPYLEYILKKSDDGVWHITDAGFGHIMVW